MTTTHKPRVLVCNLFEGKTRAGETYYSGTLGGMRVTMWRSKRTAKNGATIWNVFGEEPERRVDQGGDRPSPARDEVGSGEGSGGSFDDDLPF